MRRIDLDGAGAAVALGLAAVGMDELSGRCEASCRCGAVWGGDSLRELVWPIVRHMIESRREG